LADSHLEESAHFPRGSQYLISVFRGYPIVGDPAIRISDNYFSKIVCFEILLSLKGIIIRFIPEERSCWTGRSARDHGCNDKSQDKKSLFHIHSRGN